MILLTVIMKINLVKYIIITNKHCLIAAICFLSICLTRIAFSQDNPEITVAYKKPKEIHFSIYAPMGGIKLDHSDINSELDKYGYEYLPEEYRSLGIGLQISGKRFVWGFALYDWRPLKGTTRSGNYQMKNKGTFYIFQHGYKLLKSNNWSVFPYVGVLGGGSFWLTISQPDSMNFDDFLQNPKRSLTLRRQCWLFDVGFAFDYLIPFHINKDGNETSVLLGARIGYVYDPGINTGWFYGDDEPEEDPGTPNNVNESFMFEKPDMLPKGPYIYLLLGINTKEK